jgi:hypothetical protein
MFLNARYAILGEYAAERVRQDGKFGRTRAYPNGTGGPDARAAADLLRSICKASPADGDTWAKILAEEVGEGFAETDDAALRVELVQAAAVITAWIEDIDRRVPR